MAYNTIDQFMSRIGRQRGMSLTTGFDVYVDFPATNTLPQKYYFGGDEEIVHMLCDEAQLPNVQTATGQLSGRFLGEQAVQYPHSRLFTDVGLGFLCDAKLIPLKFWTYWYNWMFGDDQVKSANELYSSINAVPLLRTRSNRLKYQDDYAANVRIVKTEPNDISSNGRAPISYILENAYPYAIDAVPLSYGSSQLTRVNVSLHYSRHTVVYGDETYDESSPAPVPLALNFLDEQNNLNFTSGNIG